MNEPVPNDLDEATDRVELQADALHRGAVWIVWTAMSGLGSVFAIVFYLWRDWKLGYNVHPAFWEAPAVGLAGVVIGLGLSLPFFVWFRLQAALVTVQLKLEENTRIAGEQAQATARSVQDLANASMSGEWPAVQSRSESSQSIGPVSGSEFFRDEKD